MSKLAKFALIVLLVACATISSVKAYVTGRIVGGFDAKPDQFPYQISLRKNNDHYCGGSIISPKYILTAAHCVVETGTKPYDAKIFTVLAGTRNRNAGGVVIQVKRIIVNELYSIFKNDVALLELEQNLVYSRSIQHIEMATAEVPPNEGIIVSGWGLLKTNGVNVPIILQWNKVKSLTTEQCLKKIIYASDAVICLDHPVGAGICNGDSGGPAVWKSKPSEKPLLVGVGGFVVFGCGGSRPDGYAKVSYNIKWIRKHMN